MLKYTKKSKPLYISVRSQLSISHHYTCIYTWIGQTALQIRSTLSKEQLQNLSCSIMFVYIVSLRKFITSMTETRSFTTNPGKIFLYIIFFNNQKHQQYRHIYALKIYTTSFSLPVSETCRFRASRSTPLFCSRIDSIREL